MYDYNCGYSDCSEGISHKTGQSSDYDSGYSDCFSIEQITDHLSLLDSELNNG